MIVVDASVLSNAVGDDETAGWRARDELRGTDRVVAPDLVDVETVSVLRKRWLNRTLSDQRFEDALYALEALEIDRYPTLPLMRRAFELRANLSAYDAAYVALAEVVEGELLTADGRLASAPGPRCEIRVLSD